MPEEPHVNDYLDALRVPLGKAVERTRRAFEAELNASSRTGLGGNTIRRILDLLQEEFEASVAGALATLKSVKDSTNLDASTLRGLTAQELENFARQLKAIVPLARLRVLPDSPQMAIVQADLAKLDEHLRFALRQFDVGLFDSGPAAPPSSASGAGISGDVSRRPPLGAAAKGVAGAFDSGFDSGAFATAPRMPPPDPAAWGGFSNFDDAAARITAERQRSHLAALSTNDVALPPMAGEGTMTVVADSGAPLETNAATQPSQLVSYAFRENAEHAEALARGLSKAIKDQIERLKGQRHNEPEWQGEIDFLELISAGLDRLATLISEAKCAATAEEKEKKFAEAETLAKSLGNACLTFAQNNYERVINYGAYSAFVILGTSLFTTMFGVPADHALAAQLALLGLSSVNGKKSND
jgi:hypothetical protein